MHASTMSGSVGASPDDTIASDGGVSQYLSFTLGAEEYGIDILAVQEIRGYSGIRPIPNTPPHIKGVMNLRGTVVPVIDLRSRLSLDVRGYTQFTVVIVVQLRAKLAGLIVDAVSDVLDISRSAIRPVPDLGSRAETRFIQGMATVNDKLVVLLCVSELLNGSAELEAATPSP